MDEWIVGDQGKHTQAKAVVDGLRALRLKRGVRLRDMARRMGLTTKQLKAIERAADIELRDLVNYVAALGGTVELRLTKKRSKRSLMTEQLDKHESPGVKRAYKKETRRKERQASRREADAAKKTGDAKDKDGRMESRRGRESLLRQTSNYDARLARARVRRRARMTRSTIVAMSPSAKKAPTIPARFRSPTSSPIMLTVYSLEWSG